MRYSSRNYFLILWYLCA